MKNHKEGNTWLSVPAFGDWDQKHDVPDYSVDFSKIREMRKQNKTDFNRASIGNEEELISHHPNPTGGDQNLSHRGGHHTHSPTTKRKILSYFSCCTSA